MSSFKPFSFFNLSFFLLLLLLLSLSDAENVPARNPKSSNNLLRISCLHARYPALCLRSLSAYAASAKTPTDLAHAAVSVCLSGTQNATGFLSRTGTGARRGSRRERGALRDCIEQLSDSVDELDQTLRELRHLRSGTFRWQLSNAETWVSAALTNEDTCLDGFAGVDGSVKAAVRRKIARVARLTSNALYLINRLASTRP